MGENSGKNEAVTYSISDDGESFTGSYPDIASAKAEFSSNRGWIAENVPIAETVGNSICKRHIDDLIEDIDIDVSENMGTDDSSIELDAAARSDLLAIVTKFIVDRATFNGFEVRGIVKVDAIGEAKP